MIDEEKRKGMTKWFFTDNNSVSSMSWRIEVNTVDIPGSLLNSKMLFTEPILQEEILWFKTFYSRWLQINLEGLKKFEKTMLTILKSSFSFCVPSSVAMFPSPRLFLDRPSNVRT